MAEMCTSDLGSGYFAPVNIPITATAVDIDGVVVRLELFADNVKLGEKTNSPLTLTWTNAPKGAHVLKAVATDNRGATNTSALVNITVSNTPPTVVLTSPTNGATFIEGDVITLAGTASDVDGTNLVVKFMAGTNL